MILVLLLLIALITSIYVIDTPFTKSIQYFLNSASNYKITLKKVNIPQEYSRVDLNGNSVPDPIDMVQAARKEVENKTPYKSVYYAGGYPPDSEGVCTDVIWRSFKGININLKDLIDSDIKENTNLYYRVKNKPDPNIDFRRVPNLDVFFSRFAINLTTEVVPGNVDNLKQWQPGDIVVILEPYEHIAIVSDKRTKDGVPYVIHNSTPNAAEVAHFNLWGCKIKSHYRWKY